MTVAGVVPDIKHMGLKADEGPVVYIPYAQKTQDWLAWTTLLVRTAGEPMDFVPAVRNAIRGLDKNQPVAEIGTLEESLSRSTAMPRFTTFVIGVVSGFALLIAVVGVYGLLAYTVAQRMPELGIRSDARRIAAAGFVAAAATGDAARARGRHRRTARRLVVGAMAGEPALRRAPARSCDLRRCRGRAGPGLTGRGAGPRPAVR